MGRVCGVRRLRQGVRVGAPDPRLTGVSGMVAVTELVDRLGMVRLLDAVIGPIKRRERGFGGGQLLVGLAGAQLAGEDFLVGLDRQRGDVAGRVISPVAGLSSRTAAGGGPAVVRRAVAGGGDRGGRCPRGDARRGAAGPGGSAVR